MTTPIIFRYTNYRGEPSVRNVVPVSIHFKSTPHHPEAQWIMKAWDISKQDYRDFALSDCDFRTQESDYESYPIQPHTR